MVEADKYAWIPRATTEELKESLETSEEVIRNFGSTMASLFGPDIPMELLRQHQRQVGEQLLDHGKIMAELRNRGAADDALGQYDMSGQPVPLAMPKRRLYPSHYDEPATFRDLSAPEAAPGSTIDGSGHQFSGRFMSRILGITKSH